MNPYFSLSEADVREMLAGIGLSDTEALFGDIPAEAALGRPLDMPDGLPESAVRRRLAGLAEANRRRTIFIGGGFYDHEVPAAVDQILRRAEFYSAYTPYQPEISQGILQSLFEFQSFVAELTGLPVSNASLYDVAASAVEACAMAVNAHRKGYKILVSGALQPSVREVLLTYYGDLPVEIVPVPAAGDRTDRAALSAALGPDVAGVLVQTPNMYGAVEDMTGLADEVHAAGARLIQLSNPLALALLASPGENGADIAGGDTQPLGLGLNFGGPGCGYLACTEKLMRRMPGRIAGRSEDADGRTAYVLTLQAREQHIKRERATSNVCTNQGLAALASTVHLALLGPEGLRETARQNVLKTRYLHGRLTGELGISPLGDSPVFNEFTLRLPVPRGRVAEAFDAAGIAPGLWLSDLDAALPDDLFTVAVTERRTREELDSYVDTMKEVLG